MSEELNFYTREEEFANAITHGIGVVLAIVGAVLLIVFSSLSRDFYKIISFTIFGITLFLLYLGSTLYHSIPNKKVKRFLRIIDHSSIYLLIAGTYTPYVLVCLRDNKKAMAIFIMTGFMGSLPKEMEEAAVMDGCNIYQIFFKIIMPISKSSIVTVAVVTFINIWNDLLLPQIFLTDSSKMTLPVGLTEFQGQYATNYVAEIAAVIITIVPSVIVYIWLHRHIMEGMVAGAVKG